METLKLNSDGRIVIPGLGNGKKKLTIKKLNDAITHIPDTYSIDVDIESKQGLLPPERVTQKENYPFQFKLHSKVLTLSTTDPSEIFYGIPYGCNGFIPDYIDTNQLFPGDNIYVIDPGHNDTSKYVLDENRQWRYVGDFNDPEIGGVDGVDYSHVTTDKFGGFWLIRKNENANDYPFIVNQKNWYGSKRGYVLYSNNFDEDTILVSYDKTSNSLEAMQKKFNSWTKIEGSTFESLGISDDNKSIIMNSEHGFFDGYWLVENGEVTWYEGVMNEIDATQTVYPPEEGREYNENLLVNPYCKPVKFNDLIFEGEVNAGDGAAVMYYNQEFNTLQMKSLLNKYLLGKGWGVSTAATVAGKVRTVTTYDWELMPGQAFWYARRGSTPLTVRFPENV